MTVSAAYGPISEENPPPFAELKRFRQAFELLDEIGPSFSTGASLGRLEDGLLSGGHFRGIADGKIVPRLGSISDVKGRLMAEIPIMARSAKSFWSDFARVLSAAKSTGSEVTLRTKLDRAEMAARGLIYVRTNPSNEWVTRVPTTHEYRRVPQSWGAFIAEWENASEVIETTLLQALNEGRILAIRKETQGARMMLPHDWPDALPVQWRKGTEYIFSADLPIEWAYPSAKPATLMQRQRVPEAKRWLFEEYLRLEPSGERLRRDEAKHAISEKFEIRATKLLDEVWSEAPIPNWRSGGRPKISPPK